MHTDCYGTIIEDIQEYNNIKVGMILADRYTGRAFRVDALTRYTTKHNEVFVMATERFTFYSGYTVNLNTLRKRS